MKSALRIKQTQVPRQKGELARFKVIQGPDYGAIYVIMGPRASIGRGEENDIVISDLKSSRTHAEIISSPAGWIVKDKGSANGILYNGQPTREAKVRLNDTITIGETTLEFASSDAGTMMLVAPPRTLNQVQEEQRKLAEHQKKVRAMGLNALFGGGASSSDSIPTPDAPGSKNNSKLLLIGGVIAVIFLSLGDDVKPTGSKKKITKEENTRDLAAYLPDSATTRTSETIFKEGFREFLAGNYTRARTQFEIVLQIVPGHRLATIYLENCNKAVEAEVKLHLEQGKKSLAAGKLRDAKAHYERIMRLLFRDQSNPAFIEARQQMETVRKEMNGEGERS